MPELAFVHAYTYIFTGEIIVCLNLFIPAIRSSYKRIIQTQVVERILNLTILQRPNVTQHNTTQHR